MRLFVRDAIDQILTGLQQWQLALITLAEQSKDQVMPSYTHLQRAEPVTGSPLALGLRGDALP